jgi:PAS domain S-box-containing protein
MGGLCILALTEYIVNTVLIAVAVALKNDQTIWHTWTRYFLWTSVAYISSAIAAGLTAKLVLGFGIYGVVLLAPIVTSLYFTYRMYLKNVEVSHLQAQQAERHVDELSGYVKELQEVGEALKRSERDYRGLFEHAHDAIIILSPEDERVLDVNRRACEIYGLSREEFVGTSMVTLTRDITPGKHYIQKMLDSSGDLEFESVQYRRDGSELFLEVNASLVTYKDQPAILSINRDITERRQLEEQLRQVQKMESVGTLAGGIAHDFNNLMTAVIGYSTMLMKELDPKDSIYEDLGEIKKAADRAAALTRQLLAFSRKQLLQPTVLNLNGIVTDISKMLERLIGDHIELVKELDRSLWMIEVDPGQIEQVLVNLAVNARDAMPEGGRLTINTINVELAGAYCRHLGIAPGEYIMLTVSDTGCGMSEEIQKRIFEPFFTTKEVGKGTGLGLSTVHGIIKQSDGEIEVQSTIGEGTTFRLYFPRTTLKQLESVAETFGAESAAETNGTVLLVEDDAGVRAITDRILQRMGYKVLVADLPRTAITICEQHNGPIELMLTDMVMPGMNGQELAKRLKERRPEMRIIFMSGYTEDELIRNMLGDERVEFIQKPFEPDALARLIRQEEETPTKSVSVDNL